MTTPTQNLADIKSSAQDVSYFVYSPAHAQRYGYAAASVKKPDGSYENVRYTAKFDDPKLMGQHVGGDTKLVATGLVAHVYSTARFGPQPGMP